MSPIPEDKARVRSAMLDRRARLNSREIAAKARAISKNLLARPEIFGALDIALYCAVRGEVPTLECYRKLRARAGRIYFPRVKGKTGLEFVKVDHEGQLKKGAFDVLEPEPNLKAAALKNIQAMVIPGVAFDIHGHRLGWGKGFYDRLLKGFKGSRIALAYDFQILEEIPATKRDARVDVIISESRIVECRGGVKPRPYS